MPLVQVGDEKINYVERGVGAPIVFIHGAGSSHLIWGAQLGALSDIARAIALDLPGHHKSTGVGRDSIAAYADWLAAFLNALAIPRAIIVGHSMGGAIAQTFALAYPDWVAAIGLVATGARLRVAPVFLEGFRDNFDATVEKIIAYYFAPGADVRMMEKSAALLRACGQRVVLGDFSACNTFDATEYISQITAPSLVLCGREDALTPSKFSEFLAANIPGARLELIERAGHHVMIEQADAVNRTLQEFVRTA